MTGNIVRSWHQTQSTSTVTVGISRYTGLFVISTLCIEEYGFERLRFRLTVDLRAHSEKQHYSSGPSDLTLFKPGATEFPEKKPKRPPQSLHHNIAKISERSCCLFIELRSLQEHWMCQFNTNSSGLWGARDGWHVERVKHGGKLRRWDGRPILAEYHRYGFQSVYWFLERSMCNQQSGYLESLCPFFIKTPKMHGNKNKPFYSVYFLRVSQQDPLTQQ